MNQYWQEFFELSLDLLCVANLEGYFIELNPAWEKTLGYSVEELCAKPFLDFVHPDDREATIAQANKLQTGQSVILFRNRYQHKDGSYRWILWNVAVSPKKQVLIAVARDVTHEHDSEAILLAKNKQLQEAQEENAFYKVALESAETVTFTDITGRITYVNDLFCETSGYSRKELLGQDHRILKSGLMPRGFFTEMWEQLLEGKIWKGEVCNRKKDGALFWVDTVIIPKLDANGKPVQFMAIRRDITAKKAQQQELHREKLRAERATEAKSLFLANMSHEIHTPLNGILGLSNLLKSTGLNAEQMQYVDGLKKSGDHLLTVINDILDFSKIEAGRLALEEVVFDLGDIINDTVKMLGPVAQEKRLAMATSISPQSRNTYLGDPGRIRQILTNLVGNALKFTKRGGVTIQLENIMRVEGKDVVRIEVRDTGIGLDLDSQLRLFQPFTQADLSTTRRYGGTGLGLSICKRIVELMGGTIGVESELGKGSRFWLEIPLKRVEKTAADSEPSVAVVPAVKRSARALHVLVVEDNQLNQLVAVRTLEKMGHRASIAGNGKEAIAILKDIKFDFVFMDCQMPEMDGYEATEYIRTHPECGGQQIPIVAMTANAVAGEEQKCLAAGMNAFVTKPVRVDQLEAMIDRYCGAESPERLPEAA